MNQFFILSYVLLKYSNIYLMSLSNLTCFGVLMIVGWLNEKQNQNSTYVLVSTMRLVSCVIFSFVMCLFLRFGSLILFPFGSMIHIRTFWEYFELKILSWPIEGYFSHLTPFNDIRWLIWEVWSWNCLKSN